MQQSRGPPLRRNGSVLLLAILPSLLAGRIAAAETPTPAIGVGETAAATPTTTTTDAADEPITEVVITADEPRYVAPTRRDRIGRIWAPVYINEKGPFRLVLDTGSSHAAVNSGVAAALGIALTDKNMVMLRGVTGSRRVPTITVDSLIVGDMQLRPARLPIVVDALGGADGVLGTDGLQDKRIFIDFLHDRITIFRSRGERAPAGFITIPVKIVQGLLVANVRVGAMRATAIIDTGGQGSLANEAFRVALLRRVPAKDVLADEITGATLDVQRGDRVITPRVMLGDVLIESMRITTGDLDIFQHWQMVKNPVLLIGMDVLGQFDTLIIDYKRRELQVRMRRGTT
ncbi:MAG: retropepsin-like aspartic protease [Gammaproteobacteria bacterium]